MPTRRHHDAAPRSQRTPVFHVSKAPVHRRRRGFVALLLIVLLTVGTGVGSWWFMSGRYTTVPALANQVEAAANQAAANAEIKLDSRTQYSEDVPAGQIISTDPSAGSRVLREATVLVVVSLGPERFSMPKVVGLTLDEARAALSKVNLRPGNIEEVWHEQAPVGQVLKASQAPEAQLKRGTAVDLVVSKGKEPIPVTDYTGRDIATAEKELKAKGFTVKVSEEHSKTVEAGKVITQNPKSGNAHRGDTIELVRSLGPVMVEVPDVRYKSTKDAERVLTDAGFQVEIRRSNDFPLPLDIAAGTEPAAGTKIPEGSKVVLLIT